MLQLVEAYSKKDVASARSAAQEIESQGSALSKVMGEFEAANAEKPMVLYWLQYMKMVSTLLTFIRAEREGIWSLHVSTFGAMLP